MINENNNYDFEIGKLFGALCVILALFGGCWFLAYRVYTTGPTTEVITVTLPPGVAASNTVLVASPEQASDASAQTIEVVREKPGRVWFAVLLHPLGFGLLLLVIIAFGSYMLVLVAYYGKGGQG